MAARFSISDSESEPSEDVEESDRLSGGQKRSLSTECELTVSCLNMAAGGRLRLNSESLASTISRDEELQAEAEGAEPVEGAPFRVRSQSAPPALWAAKKYGRQLRRMSDEFDSWLDKGEMRRVKSAGTTRQMHHSRSWWSYLFSHQEADAESSHYDGHSNRTE